MYLHTRLCHAITQVQRFPHSSKGTLERSSRPHRAQQNRHKVYTVQGRHEVWHFDQLMGVQVSLKCWSTSPWTAERLHAGMGSEHARTYTHPFGNGWLRARAGSRRCGTALGYISQCTCSAQPPNIIVIYLSTAWLAPELDSTHEFVCLSSTGRAASAIHQSRAIVNHRERVPNFFCTCCRTCALSGHG